MITFGEKLRQEREARNITLREIATETKIGIRYLKALEAGEFGALPGGVFNKGYVRAFAAYIGADADDLVQAYLEEERTRCAAELPGDADVLRAMAESATAGATRSRRVRPALLLVPLAVAVLAGAAWAYLRLLEPGDVAAVTVARAPAQSAPVIPAEPATDPEAAPPRPVEPEEIAAQPAVETQPQPQPVEPDEIAAQVTVEPDPEPEPPVEVAQAEPEPVAEAIDTVPSSLSVPESGVGTGVVNRRLQGQSDRFAEGTQIWFWTRVVGGEAGDRVRHVWLRDGRAISSVELNLGGPHWRTQSRRTLLPGSVGTWAVEARDTEDRLLAREEFVCVQ